MKRITFLFGIHCHQPVGNFEYVFRQSFKNCYLPLVRTLQKHPHIKFALHISGPLIEWLESNEKAYLDSIGESVSSGQVEMMGGGFYEPILTVIPKVDAIGQLNMMSDYIEERFGKRPRGVWLTERIWEPQIASILKEAGIEYTNIDDAHFTYSGLQAKDLFGYYVTEDNGAILKVFPTDKTLRYTIPFKLPDVTIDYLRSVADESGTKSATLGDDGEKFGVWPGTHKWVYTDGYLENLCRTLERNQDWIRISTFSEYIDYAPPVGRIYLPTASYEEMMEWALPTASTRGYEEFVDFLKKLNAYDPNKPYIRGGFWRNFMAKYPESNLMHKKMIRVSRKVHSRGKSQEALKSLWKAQCNCAYWHGLFGGLYLNYLRHAIYDNLIQAEKVVESSGKTGLPRMEFIDHDMDGVEECIVETETYNCYISPNYGGAVIELDYRPSNFNLLNCLARREEAYHHKIRKAGADKTVDDGLPKSAHDIIRVKEDNLERFLSYDMNNRYSFIERIVPCETTLDDFMLSKAKDSGEFAGKPYIIQDKKSKKRKMIIEMERSGFVNNKGQQIPVNVLKKYEFNPDEGFRVKYEITGKATSDLEMNFSIETNFTMLAGNADDRYYLIPGAKISGKKLSASGTAESEEISMVDEWSNIRLTLSANEKCLIMRYPVETVSQSEDGFEKNYQCSCILFNKKINLRDGIKNGFQIDLVIAGFK